MPAEFWSRVCPIGIIKSAPGGQFHFIMVLSEFGPRVSSVSTCACILDVLEKAHDDATRT